MNPLVPEPSQRLGTQVQPGDDVGQNSQVPLRQIHLFYQGMRSAEKGTLSWRSLTFKLQSCCGLPSRFLHPRKQTCHVI